ncbi:MAG: prepilin-type N-terminal cleavage/methylation domain-containing protein [Acidobacteriota bacterium]
MNKKGFTLIELLIVVAIIGIVAAIAIPNLLTAIQKSKQKSTMGDMKSIGTAVESYMTDNYIAPSNLTDAGFGDHRSFHIKKFPETDAWGGRWSYMRDAAEHDIYSIGSGGRDTTFEGYDQENADGTSGYTVNSLTDFDNDIIYSNGAFVYGPRVK